MNTTALLNLGLHSLVLAATGWLLVRWMLKDARQRAWTALMALLAAALLPLVLPMVAPAPAAPARFSVPIVEPGGLPAPAVTVRFDPVASSTPPPVSFFETLPWRKTLVTLWLAGTAGFLMIEALRFARHLRWQRKLRLLAERERQTLPPGTVVPRLLVDDLACGPCLTGWLRPAVVVPAVAFPNWSAQQWCWTLAHEAEHRRGGDLWLAALLRLLRAWLWWNPFVRALIGHWEQAREEICDAAALAARWEEAPVYSSFLIELAARNRGPSSALAMAASRPAKRLRNRLQAVLEGRRVAAHVHPALLMVLLMLLGLTSLASRSFGLQDLDSQAASTASDSPKGELLSRVFKLPPSFDGADQPQAWLEKLGVVFPEGASAVFNRATSQLVVRHQADGLARIEHWLKNWQAGAELDLQKQVYVSTKWIEMPDNVLAELQRLVRDSQPWFILTDPQFRVVIRMLSQQKGVDLLSAPGVTTRFGQQATVEVLRHSVADPDEFAGVRASISAQLKNWQIEVAVQADMGVAFRDGKRLTSWSDALLDASVKINHLTASRTARLDDGHTMLLPVGNTEPNRQVILCVTAQLIDPSGQAKVMTPDKLRQLEAKAAQAPPRRAPATPVPGPRQVRLKVRVLERQGDSVLAPISPAPAAAPDPAPSLIAPPAPAASSIASRYTLQGVLTADQYTELLRALAQDQRATVIEMPLSRVQSGKTDFTLIESESLRITSAIGADGYTIDLGLRLLDSAGETGVTIWTGQTVILGGVTEVDAQGKPVKTRAICVTAGIEP